MNNVIHCEDIFNEKKAERDRKMTMNEVIAEFNKSFHAEMEQLAALAGEAFISKDENND